MEKILSRSALDEVLECADLFDDEVSVRDSYKGRGYGPAGFGLVLGGSKLFNFFTQLGIIGRDREEAELPGLDTDQAVALAKAAETDNMGHDIIVYFPGWTLVED